MADEDKALIEHMAQRLYEHRFNDPGARTWEDMRAWDRQFADIYRDNA